MSVAPKRPCAFPRCGTLVTAGRCAVHQLTEKDRPNFDTRKWYRTPRWRALRKAVLRAQPFCPDCAADGRRVATTDADHIRPHRGDPTLFWDQTNIQGKCHAHHSAKTGRGE